MIKLIIEMVIGYFPFIMTMLALFLGLMGVKQGNKCRSQLFIGYLSFFAMGLSGIWGFIFHAFFPEIAAKFIGWATSPFQFEMACANLGVGIVGIFGYNAKKSYCIAATIFTTCLFWGAAYGHIVQMVDAHNFAPGNAGLIFYNDLILPFSLIICLLLWRQKSS